MKKFAAAQTISWLKTPEGKASFKKKMEETKRSQSRLRNIIKVKRKELLEPVTL